MDTKKLTLADFTKKATDKYNNRKMVIEIEVEGMDGTVTFTRPSENDLLVYMSKNSKAVKTELVIVEKAKDKNDDGERNKVVEIDYVLMTDAAVMLVFNSCAFLQDEALQKSLGATDPYDVVIKIFGASETRKIADRIVEEFSGDKVEEQIKN